jgi:glycoside/pentoside/hexuronide:cation symporter, GPH family
MAHFKTAKEDIVPFWAKTGFWLGTPWQINYSRRRWVYLWLCLVMSSKHESGSGWNFREHLPRFIDALTDPIMGFISDNTKSKVGKT